MAHDNEMPPGTGQDDIQSASGERERGGETERGGERGGGEREREGERGGEGERERGR
jgi:hypothetical protein